jgi:hypothetical protein
MAILNMRLKAAFSLPLPLLAVLALYLLDLAGLTAVS